MTAPQLDVAHARQQALTNTPGTLRVIMILRDGLARKGNLTKENIQVIREANAQTWEHPVTLTLDELRLVMTADCDVALADWLPGYWQEQLWTWKWWAEYLGQPDYYSNSSSGLTPATVALIDASGPPPVGWLPETRRCA